MVHRSQSVTVPILRFLPAPGQYLCGLTWDGEYLWHSDQAARTIVAINPTTADVVRTLACGRVRADLACHDGNLCQVGGRPKRILVIDPATGDTVVEKEVLPASGRLCGIEMGCEGMWMCLRAPAVVQLRDYPTMSVQREIPVVGQPSGLTVVDGMVLFADFDDARIRAVDTVTGGLVGDVAVPGRPVGMTWDGEQVWYCDFEARRLNAIRLADVVG